MREPLFTETLQIAIVVRDLDAAVETYVRDFGIGPWDIYEFNRPRQRERHARGRASGRAQLGLGLARVRPQGVERRVADWT
jgi:hypothetical protein